MARASASSVGSGLRTCSRRATHGSDMPWRNSVPATTVKAISSSTSRYSVSTGMTNAAASVTTPRMPAQPSMNVEVHGGRSPVTGSGPGRTMR